MTPKEIDAIFQEYGQYATGKDYALVNAIAKAYAPQRPVTKSHKWVGLTDDEIDPIAIDVLGYGALRKEDMELFTQSVRAIEAKLKEKNT